MKTKSQIEIPKIETPKEKTTLFREAPAKQTTPTIIPTEKVIPLEAPKATPTEASSIIKSVQFENEEELVRAEIYINDFCAHSSNASVRNSSLEQIKRLSKPTATKILMELLEKETEQLRTMELLTALTSLNEDAQIDKSLFENYLNHSSAVLRLTAIRGISKYKDEESYSLLCQALKDREADIRKQALNLLSFSYGARATQLILKSLHDLDSQVTKTAAQICGALNIQQSISSLITLLSDPYKGTQKAALISLQKITKQNFGFNANGSPQNKKEAIECWRFWWRDNQATFGFKNKSIKT